MSNDVDLHPLIRDEFMLGSEKEEAFKNICRKVGLNSPSCSKIVNWFSRTQERGNFLKNELGSFHYKLLCSIVTQYSKFKYAMSYGEDSQYTSQSEALIQSRFKVTVISIMDSFEMLDTFNKETRSLQFQIDDVIEGQYYIPTMINHNRVLFNLVENDAEYLVLLDVDFDELKCKMLDKVALNFTCFEISYDSNNSMKFLLRGSDEWENAVFYKGHLFEDRIHIDSQRIAFGTPLFKCNLTNESLLAFQYDDIEDNWQFVEYNLSFHPVREINALSIPESYINIKSFNYHEEFAWTDNKIYSAFNGHTTFSIIIFDADLCKWTKLNFFGAGHVDELTIDEDEILTICATENRYHEDTLKPKTVYRLPMKKPDKLRYLAWSTIRRGELFFGSTLYERLMPKLPVNSEFLPFSEYY